MPPDRPHIHFIGFRGDEFVRACRVWGYPDHIHLIHDHRMYGDVGEHDVLIFGPKADPDRISEYSWQDHELW
jgi:hypothetical protein